MNDKIREVQDYFKNKILKGEFTVFETRENVLTIAVDGEYKFGLLVGDFPTIQYRYAEHNFMNLDLSKDDEIVLKSLVTPVMLEFKRNVLLAEKRAELEKLENELSINDLTK
jgi:hypothetical protein